MATLAPASRDVEFLFATNRNRMLMYVILAVVVVLVVALLFVLDRTLKAIETGRRRRQAGMRLYAAAAAAQATEKERKAKETASKELTAVLPAIKKPTDEPRRVA